MIKKRIETTTKLINHLVLNGKKNKSEKITLKSIKALQKSSKKPAVKLFQLALIHNTPIFKISTSTQKKRTKRKRKARIRPAFISNKSARTSFAISLIIKAASKQKKQPFFQKFLFEILTSSQKESNSIEMKKDIQRQALSNRYFFRYYRWH